MFASLRFISVWLVGFTVSAQPFVQLSPEITWFAGALKSHDISIVTSALETSQTWQDPIALLRVRPFMNQALIKARQSHSEMESVLQYAYQRHQHLLMHLVEQDPAFVREWAFWWHMIVFGSAQDLLNAMDTAIVMHREQLPFKQMRDLAASYGHRRMIDAIDARWRSFPEYHQTTRPFSPMSTSSPGTTSRWWQKVRWRHRVLSAVRKGSMPQRNWIWDKRWSASETYHLMTLAMQRALDEGYLEVWQDLRQFMLEEWLPGMKDSWDRIQSQKATRDRGRVLMLATENNDQEVIQALTSR